jgi:23S rRNA (cytosine1962-C5)-methyltransferase
MGEAMSPTIAPAPIVMRTTGWSDYALLDSGNGKKLERYGRYTVVRPEPQCFWSPRLPAKVWDNADAVFDPSDEDEAGRWRFKGKPIEKFPLAWGEAKFHGQFTPFRHLAFFPEQAANWAWQDQRVRAFKGRPPAQDPEPVRLYGRRLLVCAAAGAAVTHVDASKKSVGFARENAAFAGLEPTSRSAGSSRTPASFVAREVRRGNVYDGIILDPPKFGRGADGEVWRLFEDLTELTANCAELLSDDASFLLMNAYAARVSARRCRACWPRCWRPRRRHRLGRAVSGRGKGRPPDRPVVLRPLVFGGSTR